MMFSKKEKPEKDAGEPVNMSLNNHHGYAEAGNSFGLPVGITFTGTAFSEPTLIKFASGFEHVIQARIVPQFLPTLPTSTPTHHGKSAASPKVRATTKMRPHMI